jgi:hypothetical protein
MRFRRFVASYNRFLAWYGENGKTTSRSFFDKWLQKDYESWLEKDE